MSKYRTHDTNDILAYGDTVVSVISIYSLYYYWGNRSCTIHVDTILEVESMTSVNNIAGQSHISIQTISADHTKREARTASSPNFDTFTFGGPQLPQNSTKVLALTEDMVSYYATKYNVKSMDRKQYTNLLVDLRNAGVLSSQEYSAAYGGAMPTMGRSISWPNGCAEIDFTSFLKDCVQLCEEVVSTSDQSSVDQTNNSVLVATYSRLSKLFDKIGDSVGESHTQINVATKNASPLTKEQREVERLTALLKEDKSFSESSNRDYFTHPLARELASAMILADKDVQAQIAKELSVSISQMKAMLTSNDRNTSAQVLFKYDAILVRKARTEGLTETEKLLDSRLERISTVSQGTFNERMESIQKEIEESFRKENMCVNSSKTYSFHLDTSNFTFSVTGGTDRENWMMANIINNSKNLLETLSALYGHRREDGQYNPWVIEDLPYKDELLQTNGVASVSNEYMEKMKKLFPAWNQQLQNNYLRNRYGFGLDDIEYIGNGTFAGKTDEITEFIASMGTDFIKYGGGSLLSDIHTRLLSRYGIGLHEVYFTEDGTPVGRTDGVSKLIEKAGNAFLDDIKHPQKIDTPIFDGPMFILENGQFKVLYK